MCCLFIVSRQWNDSHWVCSQEILPGKGGWHLLGDLLSGIYCNNAIKTENSSSATWPKPYHSISGQCCISVSKAQWICSTVQLWTIPSHSSCTLNQDKKRPKEFWNGLFNGPGGVGRRHNLLHSPNTQVQLLTPNKTTCSFVDWHGLCRKPVCTFVAPAAFSQVGDAYILLSLHFANVLPHLSLRNVHRVTSGGSN